METLRTFSAVDRWIAPLQSALTVMAGARPAQQPDPAAAARAQALPLDDSERMRAAALMRVNHVGEICAQALYEAQGLMTDDEALRQMFRRAAAEESDHLAWTRGRIEELGGRISLLAPAWYAGAFAIGCVAGLLGDRFSLGFMAETENQVEDHLHRHARRLPKNDYISHAIVDKMRQDEAGHARTALHHGASPMPLVGRMAMKLVARVMTTTAHYV